MKINLLLNGTDIRAGYVNIDPLCPPNDPERSRGVITNLDYLADDAEVTDLIALDIIDFLPSPDRNDIIRGWVKKLRHGGTITIGGVDLLKITHHLESWTLTIEEANLLLYGAQAQPWNYRKSTVSLPHMTNLLKQEGLKVIRRWWEDHHYYVQAQR